MKKLFLILIVAFLATGCATIKEQAVTEGMYKNEVVKVWGKPDAVQNSLNSCCSDKNEETWHYYYPYSQGRKDRKSVVFRDSRVEYVFLWK